MGDYHIQNESTLYQVPRLAGGGPKKRAGASEKESSDFKSDLAGAMREMDAYTAAMEVGQYELAHQLRRAGFRACGTPVCLIPTSYFIFLTSAPPPVVGGFGPSARMWYFSVAPQVLPFGLCRG